MNLTLHKRLPRWILPTSLIMACAIAGISFLPAAQLMAAQSKKSRPLRQHRSRRLAMQPR